MGAGERSVHVPTGGIVKAIEIATRIGDTLVELRYCREPTVRASRWPHVCAAIGIVCAVTAAVAIGISVATAAHNEAAFRTWIESRPAWAFRPVTLSPIYDVLAFGGCGLALIAFVAALGGRRRFDADPALSALAWPRPPEADLDAVPMPHGLASIEVSRVRLVREDLQPRVRTELAPILCVLGSVALHASPLLLVEPVLAEESPIHVCGFGDGLVTVSADDEPTHPSSDEVDPFDNMPRTSMQLPKFVERAWPDSPPEHTRDAFPEDPELARLAALEQLRAFSTGHREAYGGLLGSEAGEMSGGFGFGRSSGGGCCGGTGWGTIGTGRYGTIGHGSGRGSGYSLRGGRGGMRGRTVSLPTTTLGQPTAQGDIDRAVIRRYMKRNIQKITYCYEKQLLAKPSLVGSISVRFLIAPNGTVQSVTAAGVDETVASCVADVVRAIQFPKPRGGGPVQVHYPLIVRPAGS